MSDIQRLHVAARYSEAAVFNGVVYLAGMVPECEATDIRSQTADVLRQIDVRLAECNSDKSRILRTQIYLRDIADISAMNEVWDAWVAAGHAPPARHGAGRLGRPHLAHRGGRDGGSQRLSCRSRAQSRKLLKDSGSSAMSLRSRAMAACRSSRLAPVTRTASP